MQGKVGQVHSVGNPNPCRFSKMERVTDTRFVQTCSGKSQKDALAATGLLCLEFFVFYLFASKNHRRLPYSK
jgi:hypothetical protein